MFETGIMAAFTALICWGVADFLIQRSARKFGDWETLFVIALLGIFMLLPFVYTDLVSTIFSDDITFLALLATASAMFVGSLVDFEALKKGKIAVVEPVYALEVPITAILAFFVVSEVLETIHAVLITILIAGLFMVTLKSHHLKRKAWLEKGVILAVVAAVFMGTINFLVGFTSRITNPLLVVWFINLTVTLFCAFYLICNKKLYTVLNDIAKERNLLIGVGVIDNLAWIAFAISATSIPIAIAVGISESYIALAAMLGVLISRERLLSHQKIGLLIALSSAVALSFFV